jgi:hypothetical protein
MKQRGLARQAGVSVVSVSIVCCGLPLLLAGLVATGAGAWLLTRGSLLAVALLVAAAGLVSWRWRLR